MMTVTILGSGAALPALGRHCSSQVVAIDGARFLVDCGEGTQTQIRIAHQKLQAMNRIFISHLHGDHFFGLPGLLSTMHLCGRTKPVDIYSPPGLKVALETFLEASGSHLQFEIVYHEMDTSQSHIAYCDDKCRITAFPLIHTMPTFGYLFEELSPRHPNRYAYCSDTGYTEDILPYIKGVDVLCVESTFSSKYEALANEKLHCTATQAATIALKAEARQLMITHFSARYKDVNELVDEAKRTFPNTIPAIEAERIDVRHFLSKLPAIEVKSPIIEDESDNK